MKSQKRSIDPCDSGRPAPVECVVGETLCRVRVLTEAQWEALAPERRPATAEYFPGLGWLVATANHAD